MNLYEIEKMIQYESKFEFEIKAITTKRKV